MRDAWGRVVVVEGLVTRDAETGRPLEIRQVKNVHFFDGTAVVAEAVDDAR
jgi:hypothetical protein